MALIRTNATKEYPKLTFELMGTDGIATWESSALLALGYTKVKCTSSNTTPQYYDGSDVATMTINQEYTCSGRLYVRNANAGKSTFEISKG